MFSLTIMMSSSSMLGFTSSFTSSLVSNPMMLKSFLGEPASGSTTIFSFSPTSSIVFFCFSPLSSLLSISRTMAAQPDRWAS